MANLTWFASKELGISTIIPTATLEGWCDYYGYDMKRMKLMFEIHDGNPYWVLRTMLWSKLLIGTPEHRIEPTADRRAKVSAIMKKMYCKYL